MKTLEESIAQIPDHLVDEVFEVALQSTRRKIEFYCLYLATLAIPLVPYFVVRFAFHGLLESTLSQLAVLVFVMILIIPAMKVFTRYGLPWVWDRAIVRELQRRKAVA
jgi:hypothetical protein